MPSLFTKTNYLYGTSGKYSENFSKFPKWTSVCYRHQQDMAKPAPKLKEWANYIDSIRHKPVAERLALVNHWTNAIPYIPDTQNWNDKDYWASPLEFFTRGGDCEDYAAAKYFALRMLGHGMQDLRLVVLNDEHKHVIHAVLVAYYDNKALLLDNQVKQVVAPESVKHYKPIYALNEKGWWSL